MPHPRIAADFGQPVRTAHLADRRCSARRRCAGSSAADPNSGLDVGAQSPAACPGGWSGRGPARSAFVEDGDIVLGPRWARSLLLVVQEARASPRPCTAWWRPGRLVAVENSRRSRRDRPAASGRSSSPPRPQCLASESWRVVSPARWRRSRSGFVRPARVHLDPPGEIVLKSSTCASASCATTSARWKSSRGRIPLSCRGPYPRAHQG